LSPELNVQLPSLTKLGVEQLLKACPACRIQGKRFVYAEVFVFTNRLYSLGKMSDNCLEEDLSISNWMLEHQAFAIAKFPLPANDNDHRINEMIKLYDDITKPGWPKGWTCLVSGSMVVMD
jgi:hypothetical protein